MRGMSLVELQRTMLDKILASDESGTPSPDGIQIYRNAYRNRLIEALRSSFERTCRYVGDEAFDTAACHHIILNPPASWTLDDYGAGFDQTLEELFAEDPEVAELAWFEWHMQQAFGSVDADPLDAAKLASGELGITDWDRACFGLVPSLAMRTVRHDCIGLWQALEDSGDAPAIERLADTGHLIVWRKEMMTHFRFADPGEGQALAALADGQAFGALCTSLATELGSEAAMAQAGGWLARWMHDGLLAEVRVGGGA
jgi:Putative DNA-binding domain